MKLINTKVHGVLDYLVSILVIASPWLFNFADGSAAQIVPVVLGVMTLVMSLFTDYELGMFRKIPMGTHLIIDVLSGILLAASPWIFGFSDRVYVPHLIIGIVEVVVPLMSERSTHHHPTIGHA